MRDIEREIDILRGRGDTSRFFKNRHEYPWRKEPVAKPGNETTSSDGSGWGPITVTEQSPYQ